MTLDTPSVGTCPTCHAPLAAAGGLCPRCLLRGMLASAPAREEDWAAESGYLVLEKIGEGGMGEVFLAEQYTPLRREVALKRLKPGLNAAEWLRRFAIEREALARLDHPHIARVLDAGVASDGRPFYAMELIDGLPLTIFCDRRRLGLDERLRIFAMVCDAVQHAHQKGVIHGDLKPSNILVATDDTGAPDPRVIDFGVLRTAVALGGAFGTPGYASPDAAPDARSDVFSLGVVLRDIASGEDVRWIVARATATAPDERYAAVSDLAAEARRVLACRPVFAAPRHIFYQGKKFLRRNARALVICGVAGIVVAVGVVFATWHMISLRQARRQIAGEYRRAQIEQVRGQLTAQLVHRLAGALAIDAEQREHHLRGAVDHFRHELDGARNRLPAEAEFSLRQALAAAWRGLGQHAEAERELLAARELAPALPGYSPGEMRVRIIDRNLALARQSQGRFAEAERELLALLESPSDRDERRQLLFDLASLYLAARRFDKADKPAAEAVALATEPSDIWEARHLVAQLHVEQRRYREARTLFNELAAELPPNHPRTAQLRTEIAEVEEVLRKMEE